MRYRATVVLVLAAVALTCSQPGPPPEQTIENLDLGIKLASLPASLTLATNQGSSLELKPSDAHRGGVIWFSVGKKEDGVNLVAAVNAHKAWIEGLPDGEYKGAQELQGDFGSAFYSRGRFVDAGASVEETVVFLIPPAGNRLLEIHYRYPAGEDSATRVQELIEVLGQLE